MDERAAPLRPGAPAFFGDNRERPQSPQFNHDETTWQFIRFNHRIFTMEALRTAPEASTFVTIAEHQSRTPSSFHDGPPVLHYQSQRCKVVILERDLVATPALNALRGANASANGSAQESEQDEEKEIAIEDVDTWVTSE